jgi:cob(I)alamin adenosyltransferase
VSIATKTGDGGETSLLFSRRVRKDCARVAAYGTVDELNSALGILRAWIAESNREDERAERILTIQHQLVTLMGEMATHPDDMDKYLKAGFVPITSKTTGAIDQWIESLENSGLNIGGWAMPGGNRPAAAADMARTICRRAEREVVHLLESRELINPEIAVFLNRLSDYLWLLARDLEQNQRNAY